MKVLAVDTATKWTGVALMEDGQLLGEMVINQEKTHSEALFPMIEFVLSSSGVSSEEVDLYVVGVGPGSFTGLRIGMTSLKTMAQVHQKPIVGISTLMTMAAAVSFEGHIVSIMDARGDRIYAGIYHHRDLSHPIVKDELYHVADFISLLQRMESPLVFVGDGALRHQETWKGFGEVLAYSGNHVILPRILAELGQQCYLRDGKDQYHSVAPNYIRLSQAQRDLEKKGKKID